MISKILTEHCTKTNFFQILCKKKLCKRKRKNQSYFTKHRLINLIWRGYYNLLIFNTTNQLIQVRIQQIYVVATQHQFRSLYNLEISKYSNMQSSPATNTRRINTLRVTYVRKLRVVLTLVLYKRNTACMCQTWLSSPDNEKLQNAGIQKLSKIIIVMSIYFISLSFKFVMHLKESHHMSCCVSQYLA